MKKALAFILVLVMLIGLLPVTTLASESEEPEENPWSGRSAVFVGDSITAGSGTKKIYYEYLEESLGFDSVTPMGVAGSCISAASDYGQSNQPLINRYQSIPSADLILVFMGTNDYGHETPLGSAEDTQDGTFYGALNTIIPALVAKHTSSKIVFVTPLHRYGFGTSKILGTQFTYDNIPNGVGATLGDYVEALKTVCGNNGVSVIDLHTECTLDPTDATVRSDYMPDGLHPNAAGHELIAGIMESHIRGFNPAEQEPVELTEMVYGNKFASGYNQTNRASSRINYYLKAGTVITIKDCAAMQWACAKTTDENSSSNLGYFPDSAWTDKETAVVEADGWVGFAFKYRDETQVFDLTKPLSDYITIEEPHTHSYTPAVTAPTCTEPGYTTYTCTCGDSYVDDYVDASGHSYENGICTGCGSTTSPYLQQLPEYITGCSNLYSILTPVKGYYTATKYDTSNGAVLSVVIPVEPGDRIAASSFGPVTENMGSVNGIRVTYLLDGIIVESLSASSVYTTYTQDGYLTVPAGVNMVSVPWWTPSDSNWLTLSQISKNFVDHSPKYVSAQTPTCTENGYTEGEICEICDASLGSREEIPATGHDYSGNTCTICGTVNILAILDGKYVSILGDSISTFNGYSNDATVNSTIGGNGPRYDAGIADTKPGSYCLLESVDDTWWMHFANRSSMKLLVNNSWAGSQVFGGQTSDGRVIPAAYLERCINLHDNTIENNPNNAPINPDVIFVYLGINDYNFNRNNVGDGTVDYAMLINSDGTYVTPTTFGEAYGILLHKMQEAYPNAQIFAMTLLPENLYSVDMTVWEQHNTYIRAAAEYYDIPVVDLAEKCAITWENYSGYMMDKIHPTTAGMELISDCIEAELVAYYTENLPHTHSYTPAVTAPTCTEQGYTTYTCECGDSYVDDHVDATGHSYANGICTGCGVAQWDTDGDGVLEILAIGNSFSVDALQYAYQIAHNLGIEEIVIGNLYIGGCSLATHATNAAGDLAKYTYYYNDNGTWTSTGSYKISTALESRSWDFVSMQQASNYSGVESTYNENLTNLIAYVQERSDAKLVWHMTWAYQQDSTHSAFPTYGSDQMTMYNAIASAVQNKIVTNSNFDLIVPNGTAVQNSRTSLLGDTTTRDGYHMSYDYGRYLTGLLFIKTVTGLSIDGITYAPSGVDAEEKAIAIESVNHASAKPFAVTQSAYVKIEPEIPDEGYILLKPELHKGAYWNATDKTRYNALIADADNSKYFFATDRFTKEELPVGSIIVLESGWQYRPDGWITDAVQSSRADTTTESYVVVTEEWWGNYSIRGFNISKVGTPSIMNLSAEDIHNVFRIYVPEEKHSHDYTSVVTAPNCTEQGYTTHTCTLCGDSYVDDYMDATGHSFENGICAVCGEIHYIELQPELFQGAFWYPINADRYNELVYDMSNSHQYFATIRFTRETLPVGSIIVLADGWQYRPDGWITDAVQTGTREPVTTESYVVVTEEWWGDYTIRAFNISKVSLPSLADVDEDVVRAAFQIYVPETSHIHKYESGICILCGELQDGCVWTILSGGEIIGAYADLSGAVDACSDGNTIVLIGSCAATSGSVIDNSITIDGNKHTVDISGCSDAFITVNEGAEVTIRDLMLDGGADGFKVDYESVTYTNYTIPLVSGSLDDDPKAAQSAIISNGKLVCDNVDICNRYTASYGGAMQILAGSLALTDCDFTHNYGTTYGGALYIGSKFGTRTEYPVTSVTITDCTFTDNYSGHGGGIYAFNCSEITITGSSFDSNTANGGKGGAIDLATENTTDPAGKKLGLDFMQTTIHDCKFTNNWAGNDGFAIQSYDSELYITSSDFIGNVGVHPTSSVGTVSVEHYRGEAWRLYTKLENCLFEGNIGPCSCYGDHSSPSDLDVIGCEFRGNSGRNSFLLYAAVSNITDCTFTGETVSFGVIDARIYENFEIAPRLTLTDVTIEGTIGPTGILVRKQNHNESLNDYTVILEGNTSGDIAVWDGNNVTVNGSHTGDVHLDDSTASTDLTIGSGAVLNGSVTSHDDTYTVVFNCTDENGNVSHEFLYLKQGASYVASELGVSIPQGKQLVVYTDSAMTNVWDGALSGDTELYGRLSTETDHTMCQWETVRDATCTEDGEQRRDCAHCDYYETETITSPGHQYSTAVTAPTCTEQGYTTYTCTCGESYTDDYVAATGEHADGNADGACDSCGETLGCAHIAGKVVAENISNGKTTGSASTEVKPTYDAVVYCTECGEEISRETVTASSCTFVSLSMALDESLEIKFQVMINTVEDGYYFNIRRVGVDGSVTETRVEKSELTQRNSLVYEFKFAGLAAKQMSDQFYVTLCDADGNIISAYQDSMAAYIKRMYDKATTDVNRALFVNLLNYGAAAQERFGYGTEDTYPNKVLTEADQAYATNVEKGNNNQVLDKAAATSVSLENIIEMSFLTAKGSVTGATHVELTYTDVAGNTVTKTILAADFQQQNSRVWKFTVGIPLSSGMQTVTCTVYNGDQVLSTDQDSLESYLARNYDSYDIMSATWQVICAAKAFFESKQ